MSMIDINSQTCTECGLCADECPVQVIEFQKGSFPRPVDQAEAVCVKCGHCVAVCPNGSLSHQDSPVKSSPEISQMLKILPEQCEQLLRSRRSVRVFADRPVAREMIVRLIEDARYAPTGHNAQEVEWLVIDDKKELNRIEEVGTGWIKWAIQNQPQSSMIFNLEMLLKRQLATNHVILRDAPVLVVAHAQVEGLMQTAALIDSANTLSYLDLAANSLGLGTCWAGFAFIMASFFPPMQAALALPEKHGTYGCILLGYNKHTYRRIPVRRQPSIIWR